jgi:hypothetical protein
LIVQYPNALIPSFRYTPFLPEDYPHALSLGTPPTAANP